MEVYIFSVTANTTGSETTVTYAAASSRSTQLFVLHQAPQHFLYFFPLPQGQGSLRPTF